MSNRRWYFLRKIFKDIFEDFFKDISGFILETVFQCRVVMGEWALIGRRIEWAATMEDRVSCTKSGQ